ncbi:flagellar filament capping protein FliD [Vibrio mediterranei]|uniref:flagellar filament capping protein FliD n=1 Tax=Vibrio mediterranei TaxID=689 RepID=UPI004069418A
MQIDAAGMAQQLAAYEVMPFETRYLMKLEIAESQSKALNEIKGILSNLDNLIYDYTKSNASVSKLVAKSGNEDYLSVTAKDGASEANLSIFVEQMANRHQVGLPVSGTSGSDVMGTSGIITVEIDGETYEVDMAAADSSGDGETTYLEFVSEFNKQLDGKVTASLVQSSEGISLAFSSDETGADANFTISASAETGLQNEFQTASDNPLLTAQDAVIWLGEQGSGMQIRNDSNVFENLVPGVDVEIKKTNQAGESPTTVTVENDSEATIESLNEFVDLFNSLVTTINGYTASGSADESRGVLASETSIRSLKSQMQNLLRADYGGVRLNEIGFEIDRNGKLSIDQAKFEEASKTIDIEAVLTGDAGLFKSVDKLIDQYNDRGDGMLTRKIDSLEQEQTRINDTLSALDAKYEMYYQRYLGQYTRLNSMMLQMDSVSGLFG